MPDDNSEDPFEQLNWLEAHENPFGVRVLDCRPIAERFMSTSDNAAAISYFGSRDAQSGERFRETHPENAIRVECELVYDLQETLAEGPVFLASAMEEKWNIHRFADVLYFSRSWTGQLIYLAQFSVSSSEMRVFAVEAWPGMMFGERSLACRQVDFLIRSHLLGEAMPHPAPPLPSKQAIALWSFSQHGRYGRFAAIEGGANMTALEI